VKQKRTKAPKPRGVYRARWDMAHEPKTNYSRAVERQSMFDEMEDYYAEQNEQENSGSQNSQTSGSSTPLARR